MAKKTKKNKAPRGLWVINRHDSQLQIPIIDRTGKDVAIVLHQTFIPLDLTLQGARKDIINASNYKRALMLKLIRELTEEEAAQILSSRDAQVEQARIYSLADNIKINGDPTISVSVSGDDNVIDSNDESSVVSHTVLSCESHTAQNNKFRSLVNSDKMTVTAARMIRKEIKKEENKDKRNRTLWELAGEFIDENE